MPDAVINGTTLYHEAIGDGPTCLVMNGWPGVDHAYLRPALDRLARRLRLVYYDHRGQGRSGRSEAPLSGERLADDAEALAAHLGVDRVLVLAHAQGALVAQELALRHPDRVAGLVLVAATPGELGSDESLADTLDAPLTPPEADVLQRVPPATDDELAATMHGLTPFFFHREGVDGRTLFGQATFDAEAARRWIQPLAWWSTVDRLGDIDVPVLLLVGRHDVFSPPSESHRISRRVAASEVVVFEESGHMPWLEEPEVFFACVEEWLDVHLGT